MGLHSNETSELPGPALPCADAVRAQVDRICQSTEFVHAGRLKSFLRFVVDETLAGRSDRLKAYVIALAVFDRTPSFDPQADPIVRIEASRLRRALEHYYLTEGRDDALIITVPKGSYVAQFHSVEPEAHEADAASAPAMVEPAAFPRRSRPSWFMAATVAAAALVLVGAAAMLIREDKGVAQSSAPAPIILVLPFTVAGDADAGGVAAAGLTGALIENFVRSSQLRVMGRETTRWAQSRLTMPGLRDGYGLTHVIEGDVIARHDGLTISVRLVEAESNAVIMVKSYERASAMPLSDIEADVRSLVLAKIGVGGSGEMGKLARQDTGAFEWTAASCKARYFQYRLNNTAADHVLVRNCLEDVVAREPLDASAWAMLSLIWIDDLRWVADNKTALASIVEKARQAASRAISLEPNDPRALLALSLSLYFSGHVAEGREAADRAMGIAPHDPEILAEVGARIAHAGEWERGRKLLTEAAALNPGNAGYYAGQLAFIAYMQGDIPAAANYIDHPSRDQFPARYLIEALIASALGQPERTDAARQTFLARKPAFIENVEEELARRNMTAADTDKLRQGLLKAGFVRAAQR